jgi:hypothetical protein
VFVPGQGLGVLLLSGGCYGRLIHGVVSVARLLCAIASQ